MTHLCTDVLVVSTPEKQAPEKDNDYRQYGREVVHSTPVLFSSLASRMGTVVHSSRNCATMARAIMSTTQASAQAASRRSNRCQIPPGFHGSSSCTRLTG